MTTIRRIFDILIIAALAMAIPSACSDNLRLPDIPDYTVVGEPVTISVPLSLPKLQIETRGDLSENQLNRVESLWIRTYSSLDGSATSDWLKVEEDYDLGVITPESEHSVTLNTVSGPAYIVAVANVDNPAVITTEDGISQSTLRELLEVANSWTDFLKIGVPSPADQTQINAPQVNALPMAGCFSDLIVGGTHPEPARLDYWQTKDFQPYSIPSSGQIVELKDGAIHLRRLVSHINFRFKSGDPNMELEVNSYQVMNVPKFSWLYERPENPEKYRTANFGDAAKLETATQYYTDVPQFGSQFIREKTIDNVTWQTFDFWQAENKHTGDCTSYADRGKKTEKDGVTLFTSLTGNTWTPNNEATYVLVDCSISYGDNELIVNDEGALDPDGSPVKRTGNATYIIHLGNILGSTPEEKLKGFNCFRNVDYTYNVTVNGVDDIRVDAFATTDNGEKFHNEEGLVVDLDANAIELDAHYGVFNIQLTEDELSQNFGFIITTYDNGEQITITEENPRNADGEIFEDASMTKKIDPKYYNWIEFRPTTGENVLALYKPRFNADGSKTDGDTFLLSDLYTVDGILNLPDKYISESGYYTVFVNEYTYEPMFGEPNYGIETGKEADDRPTWMHYVNQNPRRFYIKVSYHDSPDGNSVYARSKYAVEQQSLMTYYSQIKIDPEGTAIGVERENETFGLNLRHTNYAGGSSLTNGRWNAAQYITTDGIDNYWDKTEAHDPSKRWGAVSVNRPDVNDRSAWSTFLDMSAPLEVPAISSNRLQGGPPIQPHTIATGNPYCLRKIMPYSQTATNILDPQADGKYNIIALSALVNRNRDNNGNEKIDPEELRWYVPAMTRYVGMTLGENAMPQKLMEFDKISQLPFVNNNQFSSTSGTIRNGFYTRYMYLASNRAIFYGPGDPNNEKDNNVLWALEGTSLSKFGEVTQWTTQNSGNPPNPWQIRCVRNLGSDLRTVVEKDKVTMPFINPEGTRILNMRYFNLAAIRTMQYTGNGERNSNYMPVHTINSPYNSVYAALEYADHDLDYTRPENKDDNEKYFQDNIVPEMVEYINSNPCSALGNGWRVPNQIELTMLYLTDLFDFDDNDIWLSSTVEYINFNGQGNNTTTNKYFLGTVSDHTLRLTWDNFKENVHKNNTIHIRCVRDINP